MLKRSFFQRDPLTCARELIGCELRWGDAAGIIVETEAYDSEGDEASHTFFRPSTRAFVQAHPEGTAYVYLNYGIHWMFNVLVKGSRQGFVLIRALEPTKGMEKMFALRKVERLEQLCSGPGKLARALDITGAHHGVDLCRDPRFAFHPAKGEREIIAGPRIGISRAVDLPWRFVEAENPHLSVPLRKKTRPARINPDRS